jgi:hypothetical protein
MDALLPVTMLTTLGMDTYLLTPIVIVNIKGHRSPSSYSHDSRKKRPSPIRAEQIEIPMKIIDTTRGFYGTPAYNQASTIRIVQNSSPPTKPMPIRVTASSFLVCCIASICLCMASSFTTMAGACWGPYCETTGAISSLGSAICSSVSTIANLNSPSR